MTASNPDLTRLMNLAAQGDSSASDAIVPELYEELRRLARWNMSRMPHGQTLQATALINEAWIRIAGRNDQEWECRKHFYFAAARAMRDILIEDARHKSAEKRGGGRRRSRDPHVAGVPRGRARQARPAARAPRRVRVDRGGDGREPRRLRGHGCRRCDRRPPLDRLSARASDDLTLTRGPRQGRLCAATPHTREATTPTGC